MSISSMLEMVATDLKGADIGVSSARNLLVQVVAIHNDYYPIVGWLAAFGVRLSRDKHM